MCDRKTDALARTWTCLLAAKDNEATRIWGELFEHYRPCLAVRLGYRVPSRLRNTVTVDDILQDVYLRAFELRTRLTDPSGTGPLKWLNAISDRVLTEIVKRESRRIVTRLDDGDQDSEILQHAQPATPSSPTRTPSVRLQRDETIHRAQQILDELSDKDRDAILWFFYDALSHREIAQRLGTTEEASRSRVKRARERMDVIRERLDRDEGPVELPHSIGFHA